MRFRAAATRGLAGGFRRVRVLALGAVAGLVMAACGRSSGGGLDAFVRPTPPDHAILTDSFLTIAHRGGAKLAPEETLPAYANAVAIGADMLEMDVRATMDGVIILCHDSTVDRTSDGTGLIKDMTLAELQALDAGYRYTPDGGATYPYRGQDVRFPTLLEVLQTHPDMLFAIEIKEPPITEAVLAVIAAAAVEDRVVVAGFADAAVLQVRELEPEILTALTVTEALDFARLTAEQETSYAPPAWVLQAPTDLGDLVLDEALTGRATRVGIKTHVWTVNDPDEMQGFIDIGIDGIMTDDPAALDSLLD